MSALDKFRIIGECTVSKARTGVLSLPHFDVETPVFMPVGTKGSMKGVLPEQLEELNVQILLGNTYHLGLKPVSKPLNKNLLLVMLLVLFSATINSNYGATLSVRSRVLCK